jgi:hypothetical protein
MTFRLSGLGHVEYSGFFNVLANLAVAVFGVNVMSLKSSVPQMAIAKPTEMLENPGH